MKKRIEHYINVPIPEIDFNKYCELIEKFGFIRSDVIRSDYAQFQELANLFYSAYENIE